MGISWCTISMEGLGLGPDFRSVILEVFLFLEVSTASRSVHYF